MSENSLSETYLNGMVHIIQPGDTPEYLEDLRKRGFITVSFKFDEAVENEYANVVVTSIDTTTDANNYADGPAKQVTFIDSMTDTTNCSVTINNSNTADTTGADPADTVVATEQEGTTIIQNHLYPGVKIHMVQYGETQEYLESLQDEGYLLGYNKDNPPEEGKLTISKPNPEPGTITFVANPTDLDLTLTQTTADTTVADTMDTTTDPNNWADGPGNVTVHIKPEYAKLLEEYKNVKARVAGYGRGQAFFKFIYDSDEAETPSGYELVRTESWSGPDCTDEQIADIARYIISNDISDEQQKALMLEAVDAFLAKEEQITVADGTPNYTPVTVYSQIVSPDEKEAKAEDTTTDTEQEVTPATPRIRVAVTNNYAPDPSSPFYERYEMIKNSGALILPMDGKVTVWPSDVIEYLNKNYPEWDTDSYTEEEIAALQDTYSHFLNGDYLMQGSDNNTLTNTNKTDTTVTDTAISTNNVTYVPNPDRNLLDQLVCWVKKEDASSDSTNTASISLNNVTYIANPDSNLPDHLVCFVKKMDAETEAVKSVQVACADTDGWRTIGTLNNPDGIGWKYQAGNLTGSGAASVVWHAQELGALGVWTDGTDNWTGIAGWFDENWTMLGCGDFDGDGKDSVLMSLNGGLFYSVDLDGTLTALGGLNWSGWEFGAVGDFAGDGKDDVVLFHRESGSVVMLADGNADDYTSIGQLDGSDWNIAGAGDFDGDGRADLLVRQTSTGIAGAYAGGDMNQWSVIDTTGEYYLA